MHHRTVEELMTPDVVRAPRDMPFKEIVRLLAQNHVTAVPVVDELDRPMGVVSQADLLRNASTQADPSGRIPLPHLEEWERAKAEGARAEEVMSAPAVCARRPSGTARTCPVNSRPSSVSRRRAGGAAWRRRRRCPRSRSGSRTGSRVPIPGPHRRGNRARAAGRGRRGWFRPRAGQASRGRVRSVPLPTTVERRRTPVIGSKVPGGRPSGPCTGGACPYGLPHRRVRMRREQISGTPRVKGMNGMKGNRARRVGADDRAASKRTRSPSFRFFTRRR